MVFGLWPHDTRLKEKEERKASKRKKKKKD